MRFPTYFPLFLLLLAAIGGQSCRSTAHSVTVRLADKHRGAHVFGRLDSTNVDLLDPFHFTWLTLVPYASQAEVSNATVEYFYGDSSYREQRLAEWGERLEAAHLAGYRVLLKPHIWLRDPGPGRWRSDIYPADDADWQRWQASYRAFILDYAQLAAQHDVAGFCVGMELSQLTTKRPEFWRSLIREVRAIYSGQLTYAANWYGEYDLITFWDALDFIGIQAYFPLTNQANPDTTELMMGWQKHLAAIQRVQATYERPVIFTELGYKSTSDAAIEPWTWLDFSDLDKHQESEATQADAYRAFFRAVWSQPWFGGVHLWQLRCDYAEQDAYWKRLDFTPQDKMAAEVIAKYFAN